MSGAHFIYIPGVLIAGVVIGFILGSRAAADALEARRRRDETLRARRGPTPPPPP
jgi:hypothetical protein